ncbi:hypothetical protein [Ensifer sp. Root142]|uniref:hypothetical protein n=1 Tax=Ensifer sp. Root142 TaxID=1736461 RepID=UPI0012E732C2|nr:hypothetical protein [Ensifer sp. Root142]
MFEFKINPSLATLEAVKRELLSKLPAVKSSHRCEALGRAFGYASYSAARITSKSPTEPVLVNGAAFQEYLKQQGFRVSPSILHRAVAKVALADVVAANEHLSVWGVGFGRSQRKPDGS